MESAQEFLERIKEQGSRIAQLQERFNRLLSTKNDSDDVDKMVEDLFSRTFGKSDKSHHSLDWNWKDVISKAEQKHTLSEEREPLPEDQEKIVQEMLHRAETGKAQNILTESEEAVISDLLKRVGG